MLERIFKLICKRGFLTGSCTRIALFWNQASGPVPIKFKNTIFTNMRGIFIAESAAGVLWAVIVLQVHGHHIHTYKNPQIQKFIICIFTNTEIQRKTLPCCAFSKAGTKKALLCAWAIAFASLGNSANSGLDTCSLALSTPASCQNKRKKKRF